jgi:hypothetical protein
MKITSWLLCLLCFAGAALAQPGTDLSGPNDEQIQRQQRRAELRNALQVRRQPASADEARRQLSPQEREELREQLRQQQNGGDRTRP